MSPETSSTERSTSKSSNQWKSSISKLKWKVARKCPLFAIGRSKMAIERLKDTRSLRKKSIFLNSSSAFSRFPTKASNQECMRCPSKWVFHAIFRLLSISKISITGTNRKLKSNTTSKQFFTLMTSMMTWSTSKYLSSENRQYNSRRARSRKKDQTSRHAAALIKAILRCGVHSTRTSSRHMKLLTLQSTLTTVSVRSKSLRSAFS